jgi:hypothetical protein
MRFAALNPSYAPALEAEHATISPLRPMRDRSPVKWVERSKTKNADRGTAPANGATPPRDPMLGRYRVAFPPPYLAAQHPAAARIALPIHFAQQCGPFTTYRRTSFSPASTISGRRQT